MIKTKLFHTSKAQLLCVDLPEGAIPDICCGRCHKPDSDDEDCWSAKECSRNTDYPDYIHVNRNKSRLEEGNKFDLPKGDWQLISSIDDITEDVAEKIVERNIGFTSKGINTVFKNYIPGFWFETAKESFRSLIEANVCIVNPIEKPTPFNNTYEKKDYDNQMSRYRKAEEKVFRNPRYFYCLK